MAARQARERRPALWPYLVMPLIVLLVFYALFRVHNPNWQLPRTLLHDFRGGPNPP